MWSGRTMPMREFDIIRNTSHTIIGGFNTSLKNRISRWNKQQPYCDENNRYRDPDAILKAGDWIILNDDGSPFQDFKYLVK